MLDINYIYIVINNNMIENLKSEYVKYIIQKIGKPKNYKLIQNLLDLCLPYNSEIRSKLCYQGRIF